MRSIVTRARTMEVWPKKELFEGHDQCLARKKMKFCSVEIQYFWRAPPRSTTLMGRQCSGCLWKWPSASHSHINTNFFCLFTGSWNLYLLCRMDWKKRFPESKLSLFWTVLASPQWILFLGSFLFIHSFTDTNLMSDHQEDFNFHKVTKQFWLLWYLSISLSLYYLLYTLHFYKTY